MEVWILDRLHTLSKWFDMFWYFAKCTAQAFRKCPLATCLAVLLYSFFKISILFVNYLQAYIVASLEGSSLILVIVLCLLFCTTLAIYKFRGYITLPVNMIIGHTVTIAYKKDMIRSCSVMELPILSRADTMTEIETANDKAEDLQGDVMMFADALSGLISIGIFSWQMLRYRWGIVYIAFSFVIAFVEKYHSFHFTARQTEMEMDQRQSKRMRSYYFELMAGRESGLNIKTDNAYPFFIQKWESLSQKMLDDTLRLKKRAAWNNCFDKILAEIAYGGSQLVLILLWAKGYYQVNEFVFLSTTILTLSVMIETLFRISQVAYQQGAALEPLLNLVQSKTADKVQSCGNPSELLESEVIKMENVCFSYDGTHDVLRDVCFSLKKNEIVALVGVNGSGKSTFVNVLLGLFRPYSGSVTYCKGTDSNVILSSVVFQDYVRYQTSLRDNVGFGDLALLHNDSALRTGLERAGVCYLADEADKGLDTSLGKEYSNDGRELSGGEWQRLAISRALLGNRQVMVFDEPTAAIDPIAEYDQFKEIRRLLSGRSGILVTHRIGLCRLAHRIVCFDQGKIVEEGTHEQLMQRDSLYAQMYHAQAKQYYTETRSDELQMEESNG